MQTPNWLIQKYNKSVPRYTSYPPVPFWQDCPSDLIWSQHVKSRYNPVTGLDIYIHIPYCESLCYYCGCSRVITKDHSVEEKFIQSLHREWELYCEKFGFSPKVGSLHFGGGTPTFLSAKNLERLIQTIAVNRSEDFIGSIEIDPRTCTNEHLRVISENGIKRVSLGIQDFDPEVQIAIHRNQSPMMIEQLLDRMRRIGISSINFDLIYGLPRQTEQSIQNTIEIVRKFRPDLIAFYSYAHLPNKIKNQKLIKTEDLPDPEKKRALYELGKELLAEVGYLDIGMDHFALPGSYLALAKQQGQLHRNFMGYVDKKSSLLIGLGPSAISDSGLSFVQNEKEVKKYFEVLSENRLPTEKGHVLSDRDLITQKIILELMCQDEVSLELVNSSPVYSSLGEELSSFEKDGIIKRFDQKICLTQLGKAFMRNVAMLFDYRLRDHKTAINFSQSI